MGKLWADDVPAEYELSSLSDCDFVTSESDSDSEVDDIQCSLQISKLLVVDPKARYTAKEALAHPFFKREEVSQLIGGIFIIICFVGRHKEWVSSVCLAVQRVSSQ